MMFVNCGENKKDVEQFVMKYRGVYRPVMLCFSCAHVLSVDNGFHFDQSLEYSCHLKDIVRLVTGFLDKTKPSIGFQNKCSDKYCEPHPWQTCHCPEGHICPNPLRCCHFNDALAAVKLLYQRMLCIEQSEFYTDYEMKIKSHPVLSVTVRYGDDVISVAGFPSDHKPTSGVTFAKPDSRPSEPVLADLVTSEVVLCSLHDSLSWLKNKTHGAPIYNYIVDRGNMSVRASRVLYFGSAFCDRHSHYFDMLLGFANQKSYPSIAFVLQSRATFIAHFKLLPLPKKVMYYNIVCPLRDPDHSDVAFLRDFKEVTKLWFEVVCNDAFTAETHLRGNSYVQGVRGAVSSASVYETD